MLELDGIKLGMNIITKAPVIYDYRLRDNYNIVILASSGAGKSVTAKTIVNRLLAKYDCYLYIIDPQGEYEKLSRLYNANIIKLYDNEQLGLDPFMLFDKSNACNIIADIINAPEVIKKEIIAFGIDPTISINNINELYDKISNDAKRYLIDIIKDNRLKGSLLLDDRAILSLRGSYGSKSKDSFLLTLALAKVWNTINNLPVNIPKIILIDEGWLLFNIDTAAKFINLIARVGRKLNVILLFLTQRPEDLIINEYGRALLDNSDTKILLRNDFTASLKIAEALQLSKEEQELLPILMRGEGLLITKDYRLRVQIMPSIEELRLFATNP
jgi:type IV secretory pathway VirB4 component